MKYNKEYSRNQIINSNKTRYMFIGFIVGIIPFILLISAISFKEGGIEAVPSVLRDTLLVFGILTAIINSIALNKIISNKINASLN